MADEADRSDQEVERFLKQSLANAKQNMTGKKGPDDCTKCGDWNDRADAGYTTCTSCFEITLAEMNG